ncbi:MAG: threonine--tRNA ligase [Candidatus Aerophobetes bacterium]|nr:threonine--tRNA ligase [Candidatus Aerophobetes bacterium]
MSEELEEKYSLDILRHSSAHIMAQAVKRIFPQAKLGIGPSIKDGFYYDFDLEGDLLSKNLSRVEKEMERIIKEKLPFKRRIVEKKEAEKIFKQREESYKLEILNQIKDDEVSLYQQGEFVDLCRGPHLEDTGEVKFFRLLSLAGSYWRGKEENPMLSRIYGTSFFKEGELKKYLRQIEEAKKRDHRKIGKDLDLFTVSGELGKGLVIYYPKGALIREVIENFEKEEHLKRGYQLVRTPHLSRAELWKTSGHLDFYRKNMYFFSLNKEDYVIKPMNCPGHILIYESKIRSYKDLPLKYFELGTVYRREDSGVLHGLLRVRGFTQDDAHIFCMPSQLIEEVKRVIEFALFMMDTFHLGYKITLSTRPKEYIGSLTNWERATEALKGALEEEGLPFEIAEGEGAFYGPKIDIQMEDTLGRLWQGPTIQVDFNLPERFNLNYIASDGEKKRVAMIHRVVLGTIERFLGVLIEHLGGAFPPWLSPVQVKVLSITEKTAPFAQDIDRLIREEGIRSELDIRNEMLGYKVREAQLEKVPYMLVIGEKEAERGLVTVRKRSGENIRNSKLKDFIGMIKLKIKNKEDI